MTSFDFVGAVGALPPAVKQRYYLNLAHSLTVANRGIWSDTALTLEDRFERPKGMNEVMHRVINRLMDFPREQQLWSEADMFTTFHATVAAYPAIDGDVGGALISAFERTMKQSTIAE